MSKITPRRRPGPRSGISFNLPAIPKTQDALRAGRGKPPAGNFRRRRFQPASLRAGAIFAESSCRILMRPADALRRRFPQRPRSCGRAPVVRARRKHFLLQICYAPRPGSVYRGELEEYAWHRQGRCVDFGLYFPVGFFQRDFPQARAVHVERPEAHGLPVRRG